MWHFHCAIPYAACIRQLMCIHFPKLRPILKTTTHQPPTETTWFRIPCLLLVYLKLSNPFNTSPPQINLSKPTPILAKHDLCLVLLDFLTNVMYERQSSAPQLLSSSIQSYRRSTSPSISILFRMSQTCEKDPTALFRFTWVESGALVYDEEEERRIETSVFQRLVTSISISLSLVSFNQPPSLSQTNNRKA